MPNRAEILEFPAKFGSVAELLIRIEEILKENNLSPCVPTPVVTLWAMVSRVFDPDKSLQ